MSDDRAGNVSLPADGTRPVIPLRTYQQQNYEFLTSRPRAAIWDEAGLGKTRPILAAATGRTLVVAPGGVRDTRVWQTEAEKLGLEPPEVISYHQAIRLDPLEAAHKIDTLVLDEHHRCKDRKVSWGANLYELSQRVDAVYGATGTPMPNNAHELWAQLRMLRPQTREMSYYWPWVREWFDPAPSVWDRHAMSGSLVGCRCRDPDDLDSAPCVHWKEFYEANIAGYAMRHLRDDVLPDLPPLSGADTPLWTPMTPKQRKLYNSMKKDFLAMIPAEGITFEALTDSDKFVMLCQLSAGLSVLDPEADVRDRESGKLLALREILEARTRPTLVAVWYKNSAAAVARICDELKLRHIPLGGKVSAKRRFEAVNEFRAGRVDVLVASIAIVKEGIDGLQYASDETAMFERSWVPGDNEQTIRRLHRLGQEWPVTVRQLITPDTTDEAQWDDVGKKNRNIRRAMSPVEVATLLAPK